ncbi:Molybdenum cofactor sulfurase [Apostasia shenzhenica]|uniref:Molybdenum cofactor sulfurase n=1 Tax=Apostasia shenzhenica TaxID=1088818 RepID=A0A2I0ACE5_9ASPA|nr:Molybdenum cofactor sulfurase [Apostasia shenzhenica]
MNFMKISSDEYGMVSTVNRTAAFRLLAETYPFQSNRNLLTVYDYESEAITAMVESSLKRGARVKSACFSWPGMRIQSAKLKKLLSTKKKKTNKRGLLVFPHMSRLTGVRYPYLWMKFAQENGWQVALDACSLVPKDMDTLGITLIQPDFIICSFFKVFGENPSGFAGLFIKKSSREALETSLMARSLGIVSIIRAGRLSQLPEDEMDTTSSFSGPVPKFEKGETSKRRRRGKEKKRRETHHLKS